MRESPRARFTREHIFEALRRGGLGASSTLGEILFGGLDCGGYGAQPCR